MGQHLLIITAVTLLPVPIQLELCNQLHFPQGPPRDLGFDVHPIRKLALLGPLNTSGPVVIAIQRKEDPLLSYHRYPNNLHTQMVQLLLLLSARRIHCPTIIFPAKPEKQALWLCVSALRRPVEHTFSSLPSTLSQSIAMLHTLKSTARLVVYVLLAKLESPVLNTDTHSQLTDILK